MLLMKIGPSNVIISLRILTSAYTKTSTEVSRTFGKARIAKVEFGPLDAPQICGQSLRSGLAKISQIYFRWRGMEGKKGRSHATAM